MELNKIKSEFNSRFLPMVKKYFSEKLEGYIWFILTFTFALLIPFIMGIIISPQYTFINFISSGEIALFSMVIIASLMIDNFMFEEDWTFFLNNGNKSERSKLFNSFMVFIFPLLMVISCLIAYMGCINIPKEEIDTTFVVVIEFVTFFAIAGYAAHIKQFSWNKKKNP